MGTLTVGLSFTSPAGDIATDALAMTLTDNLTTTTPNVGVSRMTALLASPTNILTAAAAPTTTYLYLKNTDSVNIVVVKTDAAVGMVDLAPGEFMFMPLKGACITEYAFWTKG